MEDSSDFHPGCTRNTVSAIATHDTSTALRQLGLGFVGNLCHSLTPCLAGCFIWQRLAVQHVIPTDFCYNSHYPYNDV